MDKLKMHSVNKVDENIKRIGSLFPNCLTERKNSKGELEYAIDFDMLRQELSDIVVEGNEERYQFTWPEKKQSVLLANAPIAKTLRPCREESVEFDKTENLYIEGDNLDVLKLLQETYLGKVKMIYIDPPYNTGNDFMYEDDFAQSTDEYLANSGQFDEEGNRLVQNNESNGRFHTDWLNMMYPRIKVAKDLLTDNGLIFVSIDDNEVYNLRAIMNDIFGEKSFIASFIWEKRLNRENRNEVSVRHDYVLCFSKLSEDKVSRVNLLPMSEKALSNYGNPDNDPRGLWKSDPAHAQAGHGTKSQFYILAAPNGKMHELPSGRCWLYTKEVMEQAIKDNRIWFGKDGNGVPRIKTYLTAKERGLTPETILFAQSASTNEKAKNDLKSLFNGVAVFDTPKPHELISIFLKLAMNDGIVLDFFSGSAATAHAVMQLNAEDEGNRKFIMVQLPEITYDGKKEKYIDSNGKEKEQYIIDTETGYPEILKDSEARKAGYYTISQIGKERIRRAGRKIKEEIGLTAQNLDTGFRVLKLDTTNMKDVYYNPSEYEANLFTTLTDNIKENRTPEDLLFQVMLDLGVLLSSRIEEKVIDGKKVFYVEDNYLVACFDDQVTETTIRTIAQQKPYYFVMRDSSMASDSVAANFEQIFDTYSRDTIRKIL